MIADIPEEDRASEINIRRNKFPTTKTLGVFWISNDDTFFFSDWVCTAVMSNDVMKDLREDLS